MHLELWVSLRRDRRRVSAILTRVYNIARRITEQGGGSGPWTFLVDPDPPNPHSDRLRRILGLRPDEDLWVELTFYPTKSSMRSIIRRIWSDGNFKLEAAALDTVISKRETSHQAMVAIAALRAM